MLRFRLLILLVMNMIYYCHTYDLLAEDKHHQQKRTYIIHMDKSNMPSSFRDHFRWYDSSLKSVSDSAGMIYTYDTVIHGFSARLTVEEAESLEEQQGIIRVLPEVIHELHTTRTPEFLGLERSNSLLPELGSVSEVIVGVLDTGIWPELESFDDTGLGPVPNSWKGECEVGNNFNPSSCNRKLIGARFFYKGYEAAFGPINETARESKSPRDYNGHGTHTSTTAAGSAVTGASLFGYASGTARGMAPSARVAAYKVCWFRGSCSDSDILAAMERAIEDGVNVLSISLGLGKFDYYKDIIGIGAFAATAQGIFVSCSAGNAGPSPGSLFNVAPWITTVGAGTLDRDFPAYVTLGNGEKLSGLSLYGGKPLPDSLLLPLVYAGNVSNSTDGFQCQTDTLIPEKVAGKIVVCDRGAISNLQKGAVVKDAGGVGMVLANTDASGEVVRAEAHFLPTAAVGQKSGDSIKNYLFSDPNPTATIATGNTQLGIQPSPVVAAFSARGPNPITPAILKPDLIAPGVKILAGWSSSVGPTRLEIDTRRVSFNIISGTSMSCPHVSGLAILLKAAHPEWSPAAIRSALMTTAYTTYKNGGGTIQDLATGRPATPFDYGAGHVDPVAALDPGLVYDATIDDYIDFLCALNYTPGEIKTITKRDFTCELGKKYSVGDLNYPSFAVPLQTGASGKGGGGGGGGGGSVLSTITYTRTLTNVGTPATYKVSVSSQTASVRILVEPESLSFGKPFEKKIYTVTFTASSMPSGMTSFAHLEWSDGKHIVRSPIAFSWT